MTSSDIKITRISRDFIEQERSSILATFDAEIGDFRVRRGVLRIDSDGVFSVGIGDRAGSRAGLTLPIGSKTREALTTAAVRAHKEMRSEIRKAGQWY